MTAEIITTTDRTSMVTTEIDTQTPAKLRLRRKTPPAAGDKQFGRSSITNGRHMHLPPHAGDVAWQRQYKDIFGLITSDLGGQLSEGQRQLVRRCSMLSITCERMESEAAAGHDFDHQLYGMYTDQLGRTLQCLGLKQQQKEAANI